MLATIKLQDAFSGAYHTVEKDVTEEQFNKMSKIAGKNVTVWRQFDGHINWIWELVSIELK